MMQQENVLLLRLRTVCSAFVENVTLKHSAFRLARMRKFSTYWMRFTMSAPRRKCWLSRLSARAVKSSFLKEAQRSSTRPVNYHEIWKNLKNT